MQFPLFWEYWKCRRHVLVITSNAKSGTYGFQSFVGLKQAIVTALSHIGSVTFIHMYVPMYICAHV